ncbi:sensor histidine kinase [Oricola cellulosilytica]|nr:PAS domain-containing protein [Oricola cellulosilytica]
MEHVLTPENLAEHLRMVVATGKIGVWDLDLTTGHAWRNARHDEIFGYEEQLPEWTYDQFLEHVVEADRERVDGLNKAAMEAGEPWSFECRIDTSTGERRWIFAHGEPLQDHSGATIKFIGHVIDITKTKEAEEQLRLVTDELNHRVSNFANMLLSIIKLSAKGSPAVEEFAATLADRIKVLARNQVIRPDEQSAGVTAARIIEAEISPFVTGEDRFVADFDEDILLRERMAQNFSLVVHELLTNACKYGALSSSQGMVAITLKRTENPRRARFRWTETGGPEVTESGMPGFGTKLIRTVLGGAVDIDYCKTGFRCEFLVDVLA